MSVIHIVIQKYKSGDFHVCAAFATHELAMAYVGEQLTKDDTWARENSSYVTVSRVIRK